MSSKLKKKGVALDASLWSKLASASKRTGVPQVEIIRRALKKARI